MWKLASSIYAILFIFPKYYSNIIVSREDYQNQEEEECESEESDELIDDREYYISGYTKYDVVDENFFSIDLSCKNKTNTSNTDLTRQEISLNIGGSQWFSYF